MKIDDGEWREIVIDGGPPFCINCDENDTKLMTYKGVVNGQHQFEASEFVIYSDKIPEDMNPRIGDRFEFRPASK